MSWGTWDIIFATMLCAVTQYSQMFSRLMVKSTTSCSGGVNPDCLWYGHARIHVSIRTQHLAIRPAKRIITLRQFSKSLKRIFAVWNVFRPYTNQTGAGFRVTSSI